ncbi:MAG: hypothetical protein ACRCX2_03680 [Paraclostridium sp.]
MWTAAIMAGTQILGGIGAGKSAGKIAKHQEKIATLDYEYNKKEISEGFKRNFSAMMEGYTEKRAAVVKEATAATSQLNAATSHKTNVDNEFNSFRIDAANTLDSEFITNLNELIEEQTFAINEMSRQRIATDLENQNSYSSMLGNINSAKLKNQQEASNQILKGALGFGDAYVDYTGKKRTGGEGEEFSFTDKFQSLITGMGGLFK